MIAKELKSNKNKIVNGPLLLIPQIYSDQRGLFFESWNQEKFNSIVGEDIIFFQDNHSQSFKGVLRGLHYQINPYSQGKLIRTTLGSIFDVIVDLRANSSTYSEWIGVELNSSDHHQLWVPAGFAHGFLSISENVFVQYKTTSYWKNDFERSLIWNDQLLKINWPLEKINISHPILSRKDSLGKTFKDAESKGDIF